jgi:lysozyme
VLNLGIGNYRTSTLCRMVNAQNWPEAKIQLLSWDHSGGRVIPGLLRRRQAEADLITLG